MVLGKGFPLKSASNKPLKSKAGVVYCVRLFLGLCVSGLHRSHGPCCIKLVFPGGRFHVGWEAKLILVAPRFEPFAAEPRGGFLYTNAELTGSAVERPMHVPARRLSQNTQDLHCCLGWLQKRSTALGEFSNFGWNLFVNGGYVELSLCDSPTRKACDCIQVYVVGARFKFGATLLTPFSQGSLS